MSPGVDLKGDQFEWELQTGPDDHFEQADCTEWGEGGEGGGSVSASGANILECQNSRMTF